MDFPTIEDKHRLKDALDRIDKACTEAFHIKRNVLKDGYNYPAYKVREFLDRVTRKLEEE